MREGGHHGGDAVTCTICDRRATNAHYQLCGLCMEAYLRSDCQEIRDVIRFTVTRIRSLEEEARNRKRRRAS